MKLELEEFLENTVKELKTGIVKRGHPFKYVVLATCDTQDKPKQRTVVLRSISQNLTGLIYTDARSQKVKDIQSNQHASILTYHKGKKLQVTLNGKLQLVTDKNKIKELFHKVNSNAIKDYTTSEAPGTEIEDQSQVEYVDRKSNHFLPLEFLTQELEVLQLQDPVHKRARFIKDEQDQWTGSWLTP